MFDAIVVGAGHAGIEAATAVARMGLSCGLITFDPSNLGALSCNPSIGGVGKGHLIREIDALDGIAGRAADASAIHYRMLNRSKGKAVQGPRVQVDRVIFAKVIAQHVRSCAGVTLIHGEVVELTKAGDVISGVMLSDGSRVEARAVILATGTFLRAAMFRGRRKDEGGRVGERSASRLADQLAASGHCTARLKTGTPPRIDGRTIDWSRLKWQASDFEPWTMSTLGERALPQIACAITATNPTTHQIIADNMSRSPLVTGSIVGEGPRYCPSIEDKIKRFRDRQSHQIFLEPESLSGAVIYPNGISTSLPADVQQSVIQSITGLERAAIVHWGYAVEYDYLDPRDLTHSLESRTIAGLFCAGQINGTTGYEEAAAQGLVAGCNAAAYVLGHQPLALDRTNSYLGVLVDDLVLQGVSEPYRMLTARAEYRLSLRSDNAETRLSAIGSKFGCVRAERQKHLERRRATRTAIDEKFARLMSPSELLKNGADVVQDGVSRSIREWLRFPTVTLAQVGADLENVEAPVLAEAVEDARYAPYIQRQTAEMAELLQQEATPLPPSLNYAKMPGISNEMAERLGRANPPTLAAASRIKGVTPAALTALLLHVRRYHDGR